MIENAMTKVPGDKQATLDFAVKHWVTMAQNSIKDHGAFFVALSGGSTPKAIFERLATHTDVEWSQVYLFWSDERNVPPNHPDSNYKMAMDAGFSKLPVTHVYRMKTEEPPETYETTIRQTLNGKPFDLIMLGMGDDGHTASLFPQTEALHETKKWVTSNYVPQKQTYRMTMTYSCLNQNSAQTVLYVLGDNKKEMVRSVLEHGAELPSGGVGTKEHKALWILDTGAASLLST
ncbi:MAG: 6-phosphogluconolactonase [Chlamydiia bacterium]|nr:6-phosphogluconolactonase [Chlamydiia bacterium]MCH9615780.1 6-phosphogluconolactonase [Chlamydiia bacterium]MCH9628817.1 6-phosphogluconolactonase [Chlamydiia bacterium]